MLSNVVALVVTYNRKLLLQECLDALLKQSVQLSKIIVIDNNSIDGTQNMIKQKYNDSKIVYIKLKENIGGAGGFYEGIKYIHENHDYDFLWLMDDDTIAFPNSLEKLIEGYSYIKHENPSFLASTVYGPNEEPMNVPSISTARHRNGYNDWYKFLERGIVKIDKATFVSLMISREAIEKVGYPIKDYFIWGDDTEYTMRLIKYYGPAYFIGGSRILHKRHNAKSLDIIEETNVDRIKMYKYFYRNMLFNSKIYDSHKDVFKKYLSVFKNAFKVLISHDSQHKIQKVVAINIGVAESILLWNRIKKHVEKL